jgi:hypothetical protein
MPSGPPLLTGPSHAHRDVARPFTQLPVVEEDRKDAEGAQPQRDPDEGQYRQITADLLSGWPDERRLASA